MMISILDRLAVAQKEGVVPHTAEEFLSLEIARRLRDLAGARAYVAVAARFPHEQLIVAYHRARAASPPFSPWEAFKSALALPAAAIIRPAAALVALRITRRAVAVAVFIGLRLEYTQVRELSSDATESKASVERFAGWIATQFQGATLACESGDSDDFATRTSTLRTDAITVARAAGMPVWEVSPVELVASFSHPPCGSRARFRKLVSGVWPALAAKFSNRAIFDAAGLGLFVQSSRLLDAGAPVTVPA